MGLALLMGAGFARRKRYREHAWCQSTVVLLNLAVIGLFMAPSLFSQVLPELPGHLGRSYFAIATAHGVLGMLAELFACYILILGFATYVRWYGVPFSNHQENAWIVDRNEFFFQVGQHLSNPPCQNQAHEKSKSKYQHRKSNHHL